MLEIKQIYKVSHVEEDTLQELDKNINKLINDGFEPYSHVTHINGKYVQPMVFVKSKFINMGPQ